MKKPNSKFSIGDLVGSLGRHAPFDLAEEWDNVGFLAGDAADTVSGVVTAVNLGPEALAAAVVTNSNVIVCHHPPIFKPIKRLTRAASPYLYEAVRRGIGVIALHTNFDLSSEKISRELAATLGCEFKDFLAPRGGAELPRSLRLGKFITYVPEKNLDAIREAVDRAGAGRIGEYTQCSFSWDGEGTFKGAPGTKPAVGRAGALERAQEKRFEVVFPWKALTQVVAAARSVHPYEEMAYDVLELAQPARSLGYGFVGKYGKPRQEMSDLGDASDASTEPLVFHKLLDNVKQTFQLSSVTVAGPGLADSKMRVQNLAFSPGSGSSFVGAACAKGADVYVCGEVGYHQMLEARQKGLTLVILGHSYSERFFIETVASWCETAGPVRKVFETVHETK